MSVDLQPADQAQLISPEDLLAGSAAVQLTGPGKIEAAGRTHEASRWVELDGAFRGADDQITILL